MKLNRPFLIICTLALFPAALAQETTAAEAANAKELSGILKKPKAGPDDKFRAAWELGSMGEGAAEALPALVAIVTNPDEHPRSRTSALNALGHIGLDQATADRVIEAMQQEAGVFGGAAGEHLINGDFESVADAEEGAGLGVFGETMFKPGSLNLPGWTTYKGMTGFQDEGSRPGGRHSLELGPRDQPGCISQTIRTKVGKHYELKFYACSGRALRANTGLTLRVGKSKKGINCVMGNQERLVVFPFVATSPLTTITFCGEGGQGFGPVIDDVSVSPAKGEGAAANDPEPASE